MKQPNVVGSFSYPRKPRVIFHLERLYNAPRARLKLAIFVGFHPREEKKINCKVNNQLRKIGCE